MRLIDADALQCEFEWLESVVSEYRKYGVQYSIQRIKAAPTIEAKPVRHGKWVGGELGYCTCCGHEGCSSDIWNGVHGDGFCPNCGAKMGGAEE